MPRIGIRVLCPSCGNEGTLVRRIIRGREYWYVRHKDGGRYYEHGITLDKDKALIVTRQLHEGYTVIRFEGSDTRIVPFLLQFVPPHRCYVEVFGGSASLLIHKPPSLVDVYNDIDGRLVNLFMCIANSQCLDKLVEKALQFPVSRYVKEYIDENYGKADIGRMPDPDIAFTTLYRFRIGFLGTQSFIVAKSKNEAIRWFNVVKKLKRIHNRLKWVTFECKDFRRLIPIYDSESTFFYLDPPHHNVTHRYKYFDVYTWGREDFLQLVDMIGKIRGKFLLKYTWDGDVETIIENAGFNYVIAEYTLHGAKTGTSRVRKKYIFAMNFTPTKVEAKASIKKIVKVRISKK